MFSNYRIDAQMKSSLSVACYFENAFIAFTKLKHRQVRTLSPTFCQLQTLSNTFLYYTRFETLRLYLIYY